MKVKMRSILTMLLAISLGWIMNSNLLIAHGYQKVKPVLESISFNHDATSSSGDAFNIRMNYTEDVHVPEWKREQKNYPAAYIRNRHISVQAVFSAPLWVTSVKIRAYSLKGGLGNISTEIVYFNNGESSPVTFQVSGKTPDKISSFKQIWGWTFHEVNGKKTPEIPFAYSENQIFIVLELPQYPWTINGQSEPWVEALEKACNWAKGKTTPEDAAKKIVKKLFKNVGGLYDTDWGVPYYPWSWTDFTKFALSDFLENIPDVGVVNCYDMGKSLVTLSNVLGCGLTYRYSNPFGYVNCIYAIGRGWTNNPFYTNPEPLYNIDPHPLVPGDWSWDEGRSYFGNHAFASLNDRIFDACLTVDTDIDPDDGPPFKMTWMINIPWETYKAKVIDDYPSPIGGITGDPENPVFEIY